MGLACPHHLVQPLREGQRGRSLVVGPHAARGQQVAGGYARGGSRGDDADQLDALHKR